VTRDSRPELEPIDPNEEPELDPRVEEALIQALSAAWQPRELDAAVNEALIAAALEDPLAPPTEEELVASERLRRALEGDGHDPDADLARALRHAGSPKPLDQLTAERVLQKTVGRSSREKRGSIIYVTFGAVTAVLAVAAAFLLFLRPALDQNQTGERALDLARSRSTAALFKSPDDFETTVTTTRVDRIASSREKDLRSNRYALWGVR
jgi:hypothetical protein